jgi:hypothetical protein
MKMTAFWDTAPCSIMKHADVSEVRTASIIEAEAAFFILVC